jgi:hypothetical protein
MWEVEIRRIMVRGQPGQAKSLQDTISTNSWWHALVIPATWKAEIGRIEVPG